MSEHLTEDGRNDAGGVLPTIHTSRTCDLVRCAQVDLVLLGRAPPSGGGRVGARAESPPAPLFISPSSGVRPMGVPRILPWAPGYTEPKSNPTRVPEMVQVAARHSPPRGFPWIGEASWVPIHTCYRSIGRDTHTL